MKGELKMKDHGKMCEHLTVYVRYDFRLQVMRKLDVEDVFSGAFSSWWRELLARTHVRIRLLRTVRCGTCMVKMPEPYELTDSCRVLDREWQRRQALRNARLLNGP